ncbi:hypothetical protein [Leptospira sp. GIMC2001]|uniref:hypothetical protein n=1 Tax=Leptospira sp. GIMC2001 TaxID=1513297 RepID=UPI0023496A36|nr:hypothetical protein [Leptospira sp. GIMC2001]WCL48438.1 hypothetical protein O4O04_14150 [Leptospira sp. GIMC2001]
MGINTSHPFASNKFNRRFQNQIDRTLSFCRNIIGISNMFFSCKLLVIAISLISLVAPGLQASGLFFPGKFNPELKAKLSKCEIAPLPPFRFELSDFDEKNIINLTKKMRARSIIEGEARGRSITCIRNLVLTDIEFNQMDGALNSMFKVESQLLFTYGRWLESQSGLDLSDVRKFLQSRYELNNLIQSSTREKIIDVTVDEQSVINADFATMYHSVLRTYFEYIYNLDDYSRTRYFQAKKG